MEDSFHILMSVALYAEFAKSYLAGSLDFQLTIEPVYGELSLICFRIY